MTSPRRIGLAVLVVAGAVYAVSLVPGVRGGAGSVPVLDEWLNSIFDAGVVVAVLACGYRRREERVVWWSLGAGLAAALAGSLGYYAHYQHLDPAPYPSLSDIGWVAFYPLAYVALIALLRRHVDRFHASIWLDGIVVGFAIAAFATAFALDAALAATEGPASVVAMTLAYPVADVGLLVVVAGALAVIGRGAGPAWWWITAGLAAFVVTDALYVEQAAAGTYVSGGPLDLGWLAARCCFLAAVWRPHAPRRAVRLQGPAMMVAPGIGAVASLGLLYLATTTDLHAGASVLALLAVLAALARTVLTFREVQALAETREEARTDELTGLANRRRFSELLGEAGGALRPGGRFALLLVDLDRFKEVNDSLGHDAGDQLLRLIGPRIEPHLGPRDLLARLGGDEFAVLAPGRVRRGRVPWRCCAHWG